MPKDDGGVTAGVEVVVAKGNGSSWFEEKSSTIAGTGLIAGLAFGGTFEYEYPLEGADCPRMSAEAPSSAVDRVSAGGGVLGVNQREEPAVDRQPVALGKRAAIKSRESNKSCADPADLRSGDPEPECSIPYDKAVV